MRDVLIDQIWIDDEGKILVAPLESSPDYSAVYRMATGVDWNSAQAALSSPVPRTRSYADWFVQIVGDMRSEYGVNLELCESTTFHGFDGEVKRAIIDASKNMEPYVPAPVDDRTMAGYVGDDRILEEARERFKNQKWALVVSLLESLKFPEFMEKSDVRRLEIARKRLGSQVSEK